VSSSTLHWIETSLTIRNAVGAAAAYRRIFLAAVRDRRWPTRAIRPSDGLWASVAWPPYGLDPAIPVSTDDVPHVSDIMTPARPAAQADRSARRTSSDRLLSDLPGISAYLFRALSTAFRYRRRILDGDRCAASRSGS